MPHSLKAQFVMVRKTGQHACEAVDHIVSVLWKQREIDVTIVWMLPIFRVGLSLPFS